MNIINIINARVTGQNGTTVFAEKEVFATKGNGVKRFYIVANDVEGSYEVNSHINIAGRYHLEYQEVISGQKSVVINISKTIAEAATEYDGGNISVTISNAKVVSEVKPTRSGNGIWFSTTYRTGRTLPDNKAEIRRITVFTSTPRNGKPISTNQNKNLIGMKWDADVVPKDGNIYINESAYEAGVEAAFDPYKQASLPPQQQPAANNGNYQQNGGYQQQTSANNGNYQQNGGYQQQTSANNGNYQQNGGYQQQTSANNGNYQQNGGYQQSGSAQQGYQQNGGYQQQTSANNGNYQQNGGHQQSTPQGYQAPSVQQGLSDADLADFEEVTDEALF